MNRIDQTALGMAMILGTIGALGLPGAIAPRPVLAQQVGEANVSVNRQPGESFDTLLRRAENAAGAIVQQSLTANPQLDQVQVNVVGENAGQAAPVLSLSVSRNQWQTRPDAQSWATYFNDSRVLLGFELPRRDTAPATTAQQPDATSAPDSGEAASDASTSNETSPVILVQPPAGRTVSSPSATPSAPEAAPSDSETPPDTAGSAAPDSQDAGSPDTETTRLGLPNVETDPSRLRRSDDGTLLETDPGTSIPVEGDGSQPATDVSPIPSTPSTPESTNATPATSATTNIEPTVPEVPAIPSPTVPTAPVAD